MNDTRFHQLVDETLASVEEQLDGYDGDNDIDYEIQGNVMTITFENGSKIIINSQEAMHQLWLATKTGGYHFDYKDNGWFCDRTGLSFFELLSKSCSEQSGDTIKFN